MTLEQFEKRAREIQNMVEQLARDVCDVPSGGSMHYHLSCAADRISDAIHADYMAEFEAAT